MLEEPTILSHAQKKELLVQNRTTPTRHQVFDIMLLTALLALSGGFQDAYTYIVRNHVFANAQTGNTVPTSTKFLAGNLSGDIRCLFPLFAFTGGTFTVRQFEARSKQARRLYWRQNTLLLEILPLGITGFLGEDWNLQANTLVSFARAMQVQSFRKVNGNAYASIMHIGNLRNGAATVSGRLRNKKKEQLERAPYYFDIVLTFGLDANVGSNLSPIFGTKTILFCPTPLIAGVVLMITEEC